MKIHNKKIKYTLPATTIVETLVALILLSVVFGIGLLMYSNIIQNRLPYTQSKANSVLQQALAETEQQQAWFDKTYQLEGFTIQQTLQPYSNTSGVFTLTLTAITPEEKPIHSIQKLITR